MSATEHRNDAAVWFAIPARDFERAATFYEAVLGVTLRRETIMGALEGVFPYQPPGVGGSVVQRPAHIPADGGVLIYLNCDGRLAEAMARVVPAGGVLAGPKVDLPGDMGSFVHVLDPEGNRVRLHSR